MESPPPTSTNGVWDSESDSSRIRRNLVSALTVAQQAVCCDTEGDKSTALMLYGEAAKQLEEIIPFIPDGHADVLMKYSGVYNHRVSELRDELAREEARNSEYLVPEFAVQFNEHPVPPNTTPEVPEHGVRKPFWLMAVLSTSLQSGAFITPDLYLTKEVWVQNGSHLVIKAVPAKTRYCECVVDLLAPFQSIDLTDAALVQKSLDGFLTNCEKAWKVLQKEIPSAEQHHTSNSQQQQQQQKDKKGTVSAVSHRAWNALRSRMADNSKKTEPSVTYNSYIPWLVSLLEAAQSIDQLITYYASPYLTNEKISQRLTKISHHFYYTTCSFILKDAFTLLHRSMRKQRESYSRLFPAHFLQEATKALS
eukprot:TRINITY_DN13162_c0_g1_i1.p1 TRINITY_DN13162_c0_g1~~TRINITY_DN13162_c0_g1_i1.p1  ORF type:complete len:380 (+),score=71.84 TRINITY_DN13162_c0_g1_i1:46-1140(+)